MITRQFGIPVTSPGAILRREKDLGTPLGIETAEITQRGDLVPDKIIVELIEDWLRLHGGHGFVFDGFPRTLQQAERLLSILTRLGTALDLATDRRHAAGMIPMTSVKEIENMRQACRGASDIIDRVSEVICPGITTKE